MGCSRIGVRISRVGALKEEKGEKRKLNLPTPQAMVNPAGTRILNRKRRPKNTKRKHREIYEINLI